MRRLTYIAPIVIATLSFFIYLYTASPSMLWEDAARQAAAIKTLGIVFPSRPLYFFFAHWFTFLPFGSTIFQIQIFSALLAVTSLLLLYRLVIWVLQQKISSKKNKLVMQPIAIVLSGIFSMFALGFSYQFWSQAQNIETFIMTCFISLLVFNLILTTNLTYKIVLPVLAITIFICGLGTGTDIPVIMVVFPSVLIMVWYWKKTLGIKQFLFLGLLGIIGIIVSHAYLPIAQSYKPLINQADVSSMKGLWDTITGGGGGNISIYDPQLHIVSGLTWELPVILSNCWHYITILWLSFTPILLPFIVLGGIFLWRYQRRIFSLFILAISTNFVLSSLYTSGNQESWYLQSHIIFALFAGVGYCWLVWIVTNRWPHLNFRLVISLLFIISLVPIFYWWQSLDRHNWHLMQNYVDNLYKPIQEPAILVGSGDLWDGVASLVYVTENNYNYKHNIISVRDTLLYSSEWERKILTQTTQIKVPDGSHLTHDKLAEYSKFMNDFFALNISHNHIYLTHSAIRDRFFQGTDMPSLQIDQNRFALIPVGMVEEVVPKTKTLPTNLKDFDPHFDQDFPKKRPFYLEESSKDEIQGLISELAESHEAYGDYYIRDRGMPDKALPYYKKALAYSPENAEIISRLGNYYGSIDKPQEALKYFKKAQKLDPKNPSLLRNIAKTYQAANDLQNARKYFQETMALLPSESPLYQATKAALDDMNGKAVQESLKNNTIPNDWKTYKNQKQNYSFFYPKDFTIEDYGLVLKLDNKKLGGDELTFFIYGKKVDKNVTLEQLKKISGLPDAEGTFVQKENLNVNGFTIISNLYKNNPATTLDILLTKNGWGYFMRIYPSNTNLQDTRDKILRSFSTINN